MIIKSANFRVFIIGPLQLLTDLLQIRPDDAANPCAQMLVSSLSVSFAPQLVSRPCVSSSCVRMSAGDSYLSKVPMGPPDAILGIAEAFKASTVPGKVNVAIGAYRDDQGSPWVLPAVRAAEAKLIERGENKEYAGIVGLPGFLKVRVRGRVS